MSLIPSLSVNIPVPVRPLPTVAGLIPSVTIPKLPTLPSVGSLVGAIPALKTPVTDPCKPSLSIPTLGADASKLISGALAGTAGLVAGIAAGGVDQIVASAEGEVNAEISSAKAAVNASINAVNSAVSSAAGVVNALSLPSVPSIKLPSLTSSLSLGGLMSKAGASPFAGIVQAAVGGAINGAISAAQNKVAGLAGAAVSGIVNKATSAISGFTAHELRKDLGKLTGIMSALNGAMGNVEGSKLLVGNILSSVSSCPAKAELMAEAYFKQGAK